MANLFEEIIALTAKDPPLSTEINNIKETVLKKETLRCVDYRKAAILLSQALRRNNTDKNLTAVVDTVVELCEILYSHDSQRTPKSILRLTNIAYLHASLCTTIFHSPKRMSKRRFFGIYFHSLTCHLVQTCLSSFTKYRVPRKNIWAGKQNFSRHIQWALSAHHRQHSLASPSRG